MSKLVFHLSFSREETAGELKGKGEYYKRDTNSSSIGRRDFDFN